jgi:multidrug resistance protein, MATE family
MSYTYPHYDAAPSSLPSDYAFLSQYNSNRLNDDERPAREGELDSLALEQDRDSDSLSIPAFVNRRRSMPSGFNSQKVKPTMAPLPSSKSHVSENTPLLDSQGPCTAGEEERFGSVSNPDAGLGKGGVYWKECKLMVKYTLPVAGTHLLEYSLVIASVISIGHLSTTALAASTLGSMTASVSGYSILQGFANTLDTVLPSAWTSDQPHLVGVWMQRMAVVMTATLIPIAIIWANAESILLLLRQDPDVAHLAALYLRWSLLGLPAYAFNQIARRYFQAQNLFAVPTQVIFAVAPINVLLNYLLVWGPEPIRLGFIGAPIASALSFNLMVFFQALYGIFWVPKTAWAPLSRKAFTNLGILVHLGIAGVAQTASEWWSWELIGRKCHFSGVISVTHRIIKVTNTECIVYTVAASQLGPVALATQSVLLVSASTTYQPQYALSVAASVRVGNLLGERNARGAGLATNVSLFIALIIAGINR